MPCFNYLRFVYKLALCGFMLFWSGFAAAFYVQVSDTFAGDQAAIQMAGLVSEEAVVTTLERPNQAALTFTLQADTNGVIQETIYGLHLKQSGAYNLKVSRMGGAQIVSDEFSVLPGAPSRFRSTIKTSIPTLPADGLAVSPLVIAIKDAYGNPVPNQKVTVFSSRNKDVINAAKQTDSQGFINGTVYSTEPGVSVISALVGSETLFERTELVFHLPGGERFGNVGQSGLGSFLKAQLFSDDFEEVAYFSIEGLPTEVMTEDGYTFSVLAKDKSGNVVKNYSGKIRFSSDDNGVQLPIDYTFTETDQGEHEFAVAVAFATPGQRVLTVTDVENSSIQGEVQLDVVAKNRVNEPIATEVLTILSPTEGTYSSPRVTVRGKGQPGQTIKISDGPTLLVEDLSLDINGDFFYQTPALADGRHVFRAELMDGSEFSNIVEIRIDNTPPRVLAVEVDPPQGVAAGGVFRATVTSNEALASAECTFNGVPTVLARSGDSFSAEISAGETCGTYPLSCTIADILGNELQENAAASIKVCGSEPTTIDTDQDGLSDAEEGVTGDEDADGVPDWLESNILDSTGNGVVDQKDPLNDTDSGGANNVTEKNNGTNPLAPTDDNTTTVSQNLPPTAVGSLNAQAGEERITLFWSPAKDDQTISGYKILFGENPEALLGINQTPDDRTQWYVDKLQPGQKYYFRVIAVDNNGNEGTASNLVEATTFGEVFHSAAVPNSGGETNIWIPLILAAFGGLLFLVCGRKRA